MADTPLLAGGEIARATSQVPSPEFKLKYGRFSSFRGGVPLMKRSGIRGEVVKLLLLTSFFTKFNYILFYHLRIFIYPTVFIAQYCYSQFI